MSGGTVSVVNRQRSRPIDRDALRRFVERLRAEAPASRRHPAGPGATVTLCLVSDRRMRELNRRYRRVDRPTDVLSFPDDGDAPPPGEAPHLGDIVISVQTALRQSESAGHGLERELRVLTVHGYLHLLGYDHEVDDGEMMRLQRRLVRRLVPGESS